jgi:NADH-quinone oxidoreductase subunit I
VIGIAKGMATLFGRMVKPSVNERYPERKKELPPRARMSFAMAQDDSGQAQCKACMLCERSCPDNAIFIESEKRTDGPGKVLTKFTIDLGRCMYCGLCVEQCTSDGLHHTGDFENNVTERSGTLLVLYEASAQEASELCASTPAEVEEVVDTFGTTHRDQDAGESNVQDEPNDVRGVPNAVRNDTETAAQGASSATVDKELPGLDAAAADDPASAEEAEE